MTETSGTADRKTEQGRIVTRVESPVGWLLIDNPTRRNAVTLNMWRALPAAVASLDEDPAVRVIVVRGGGEQTFVAGADISEFDTVRRDARSARAYEAANAEAFDAIRRAVKPTLAMIRGFCLGGGLGIAAACDLRFAEAGSTFGIPAARLGVGYPPSAVRDVVNLIGPARAKDLFFSARRVGTDEALAIGLVNRLAPIDGLEVMVAGIVEEIAAGAPLTIRAAKAAIDAVAGDPGEADWNRIQALADACFDSADFAEGRTAFVEKRKPRFRGE